ncbi:hypothetical protein DIS24_g10725 [Lasiodiplodia hormozganensis]|uniref:Nephrocystin 3-like N-terminal domain-containing protein n=1 Tax=Lasiodiplodia hormozganensis TaxID=869390 RepID=A0AA39XNY7_9PEZI|nr:hypothetical protein DIS24_g10725 [Lasiodiplodia hormozganensis]
MPDLEKIDMERISERKKRLDPEQRAKAENVVQNGQFKDWVVSTASEILLIQGNFRDGNQNVSALSSFCATLTEALRADRRFIPLVFFCGSHLDDDQCAGGFSMIVSLVVQLLSQQDFNMRLLPYEVYDALDRWNDIPAFCSLFEWLLCQLPDDVTVFCLIDGAVYYEREEFVHDMSEVLAGILEMSTDGRLPVTFKVLVTSPTPTTVVRLPFEVDGSLLSIDAMPSRQWQPSELRTQRELAQGLGSS